MSDADGQFQFAKNRFDDPRLFAVAAFGDAAAMAKPSCGIVLADVAPKALAHFTGLHDAVLGAEALANQIVVAG